VQFYKEELDREKEKSSSLLKATTRLEKMVQELKLLKEKAIQHSEHAAVCTKRIFSMTLNLH
jgi:hypothetical protein